MVDDSYDLGGAKHYDAAYSVKEGLVDRDFYLDLANEYGGPVLEFGCGTGRITLPLARRGVEVTGDGCVSFHAEGLACQARQRT